MATIRELTSSDGSRYYKVTVSRGASKGQISRTFHPEKTWSSKTVQRELNKFVRQLEGQVESGELISRTEEKEAERQRKLEEEKILTVSQYVEKVFMPSIRLRCTPNSTENYEGNLKNWILPAIGDYKLNEVNGAMINAILLDMQVKGKSHATIKKVHTVCSSLFKMAYLNDMVETNPMYKVIVPKENKDLRSDGKADAYTLDQVKQILDALDHEPLFWQVYIHLLLETGIRRSEAVGIEWKSVDLQTGEIEICQSLNRSSEIGVYIGKPKNGKTRKVYISQKLIDLIKEFKASQTVTGLFMFSEENGQPMYPDVPTKYFKRFGEKYGIPDFHPHKLRHTCASLAVLNNADIVSVSELLGHSDTAVTLRMYVNGTDESRKKAASIVQAVINE